MAERHKIRRAFQAVGRGLAILSISVLLSGPMGGCSSCQNSQNGVNKMSDKEGTEFVKKGEDPKKKIASPDSLKPKTDSLAVKTDSTKAEKLLEQSREEQRKKANIPSPIRR